MKKWNIPALLGGAFRISVFPVLIWQMIRGNIGYVYLCVLTLLLMEIPRWAEERLNVTIPPVMGSLVLIFIFASEILGEIGNCYLRYPGWDTLLHCLSGFLFASAGYILPDLADRQGSDTGKITRVILAICFSLTAGVAWEFLEWGADWIFGLDMQKDTVVSSIHSLCLAREQGNAGAFEHIVASVLILADGTLGRISGYLDIGLHDTMGDLMADLAGAVVFVFLSGREILAIRLVPNIDRTGER